MQWVKDKHTVSSSNINNKYTYSDNIEHKYEYDRPSMSAFID